MERPAWTRDPITAATVVIAFAAVINIIVSAGLWWETRDSVEVARRVFQAANRPYVGILSISTAQNEASKQLGFLLTIKNFGTAPADNLEGSWKVLLNDSELPKYSIPHKSFTLFPGAMDSQLGELSAAQTDSVLNGTSTLEIIEALTYGGPDGKDYAFCEKDRYTPLLKSFSKLGTCDEKKK